MRMQKFKKIGVTLVVMLSLFSIPVSAKERGIFLGKEELLNAEEINEKGSITITLTDGKKGTDKKGVHILLTKVADVEDGEYVFTNEFADVKENLNQIETANQLMEVAEKLEKEEKKSVQSNITDENGTVVFKDLEIGVYLISVGKKENYDKVEPTLIAIPTWNDTEKTMQYDITVFPKHTPNPEKSAPQTGVENHQRLFFVIGIGCMVVAILFYKEGKKKNEKKK